MALLNFFSWNATRDKVKVGAEVILAFFWLLSSGSGFCFSWNAVVLQLGAGPGGVDPTQRDATQKQGPITHCPSLSQMESRTRQAWMSL